MIFTIPADSKAEAVRLLGMSHLVCVEAANLAKRQLLSITGEAPACQIVDEIRADPDLSKRVIELTIAYLEQIMFACKVQDPKESSPVTETPPQSAPDALL